MARPPQPHEWSRPGPRTGFHTGPAAGFPGWIGTGGGPGEPEPQKRGADLFALVRAWAAGIVVLIATEYLQITLLYNTFTGPAGPRSFGAVLLLVHLPNMVCIALATWAAARGHPEPQNEEPVRHAIAACTVPVAAQVLTLAVERHRPGFDALGLWLSNAVLITGCVIGWAADRWRRADA
jgi:hypothetical protein